MLVIFLVVLWLVFWLEGINVDWFVLRVRRGVLRGGVLPISAYDCFILFRMMVGGGVLPFVGNPSFVSLINMSSSSSSVWV